MNIIIDTNKINEKYIFYNDPVENTILKHGEFIKIHYSNSDININNIITIIHLKHAKISKSFNKVLYEFNHEENKQNLDTIYTLEDNILNKYIKQKNLTSRKIHSMYNLLKSNNLKLYFTKPIEYIDSTKIILKISGLWTHDNTIGIIFKCLPYETYELHGNLQSSDVKLAFIDRKLYTK